MADAEIDEAVGRIAEQNRPVPAEGRGREGRERATRSTISFTGTIDGEPFEGGTGEDVAVVIGSGTFIPGFEEQLIGIKAGEKRTVKVDVPGQLSDGASSPARTPNST